MLKDCANQQRAFTAEMALGEARSCLDCQVRQEQAGMQRYKNDFFVYILLAICSPELHTDSSSYDGPFQNPCGERSVWQAKRRGQSAVARLLGSAIEPPCPATSVHSLGRAAGAAVVVRGGVSDGVWVYPVLPVH